MSSVRTCITWRLYSKSLRIQIYSNRTPAQKISESLSLSLFLSAISIFHSRVENKRIYTFTYLFLNLQSTSTRLSGQATDKENNNNNVIITNTNARLLCTRTHAAQPALWQIAYTRLLKNCRKTVYLYHRLD